MKHLLPILIILIFLVSCVDKPRQIEKSGNEYATRFSIKKYEDFRILSVMNPWQKSSGIKMEYVLARSDSLVPDSLLNLPFIKIPVKRVVVFSTTHVGLINAIGKSETVKGVSGITYVCDSIINSGYKANEVFEVGYAPNINYERILKLEPDLIFIYGIEATVSGIISRLESSGLSALPVAEYLEPHPLGKLEWIKVFGELYDLEELSTGIFINARQEYEKYRKLALESYVKPDVFVGLPWKDTWYVAGGESFTARFIHDAGGNYLWKSNASTEYLPLSLEAVITGALKADIWINAGSAESMLDIRKRDKRFINLYAYRNNSVYNNNRIDCKSGGNPFWETGVSEPHIILKDLIKIFHPDIMQNHDFVYYRKLE